MDAKKGLRIALTPNSWNYIDKYARDHISKKGIDNSVEYACKLPWSFRKKLLHDYSLVPEILEIIRDNEVYKSAVKDGLK